MKTILLFAEIVLAVTCSWGAEKILIQENFDGSTVNWGTGRGERGESISLSQVRSGIGTAGSAAIAWNYDFSMDQPASNTYVRLRPLLDLPGKPVRFTFRLKGDNSGLPFGYRLRDATGRIWQFGICKIDFDGWKEFEVKIKPDSGFSWGGTVRSDKGFSFPLRFEEFLLDYTHPVQRTKGELQLDDLHFYGESLEQENF